MTSKYKHFCRECGEPVRTARYALGYSCACYAGTRQHRKSSTQSSPPTKAIT